MAGVRPGRIQSPEDLSALPVSTRADFQAHPVQDLIARDTDTARCKKITTSGSSGTPLTVFQGRDEADLQDLFWGRASLANGQGLLDSTVALKFHTAVKQRWFQRLGLWRRKIVSVREGLDRQVEHLAEIGPAIIKGNPFNLVLLARHLQEHPSEAIRPKAIFSKGATLDRADRAAIEQGFGCSVFDHYGTTEFGLIAWECSNRRGYHINSDSVIVEVLGRDGKPVLPGQTGRIVCTSLVARTMPFIRHFTGDMGVLARDECGCGRGLVSMLASIEGRREDFLRCSDGSLISPSVFVNEIKSLPGILQFRIVQESMDHLEVYLRCRGGLDVLLRTEIQALFVRLLGENTSVSVRAVQEIPPEKGGKWRCVTSAVVDR